MLLPPPLVVFALLLKVVEGSPFSDKFFAAEGLLQSLGIDGSEYDVEGEKAAGDDEDLKLPLMLLEPGLEIPNLLLAFDDTGELRTSLLALGPFRKDCLLGEELESDDVVDEIGDTREFVDVTTASPSSSS